MKYQTLAQIAATCCAASAAVTAESLYRCKGGIVSIGDSTLTVRETCGEPNDVVTVSGGGADVIEEIYAYGGGSSIPYVLRLRGGELVSIERQAH